MIRSELPEHRFEVSGRFGVDTLKGFDVLIPTMTSTTREMLEESDRLRLIQQCGAGIEMVDLEAARDMNIWVANAPTAVSGSADSVAEVGIYLMVGLARDFRGIRRNLENRKMGEPQGKALSGKTVGIVGLGSIGRALVKRLRPFDVHLIGVEQTEPERIREKLALEWVGGPEDLADLLRKSDFVILCVPLTKENTHLMNSNTFSAMKQGAFLINLARGGLVDREALEEALASERIAGAGLDVFVQVGLGEAERMVGEVADADIDGLRGIGQIDEGGEETLAVQIECFGPDVDVDGQRLVITSFLAILTI